MKISEKKIASILMEVFDFILRACLCVCVWLVSFLFFLWWELMQGIDHPYPGSGAFAGICVGMVLSSIAWEYSRKGAF